MAAYFWVGGSGTWDSATTTHWASLSGGVGNAGVPTAADTATFDASSGAAATVTVAATAVSLSTTVNKADITLTLSGSPTLCTTAGTLTFTAGTINLAGFTLSTGIFSSSNTNTRAIAFGTGNITLTSTTAAATVLSMATATGFTLTGTGGFTRNMAATATVVFGTVGGSTTNAPNLTVNAGASALTITTGSYFKNVNFTGSTCTVTSSALNMAGNLTLASGGTYTAVVPTFRASGVITSNTKTLNSTTVNGTGITVTLGDALTLGLSDTLTLTAGTLDLAGFTLSTGIFSSNNATTRTIAFGAGSIALTSTTAATTVLSMGNATNFTWTGTGGFTRNQAATATIIFGTTGGSTTNAINLTINAGASALTVLSYFKNLDFTGSTCTVTSSALNMAGNLTLASGGTYTSVVLIFLASGTLTSNTKTFDNVTINGTGITVTLADAMTTGLTRSTTLTAGTLDLAGFTLSTGVFISSGSATRTIAFGAGSIALTSTTAATTVLNVGNATNFTWTGTGGFTRNQAATATILSGTTGGTVASAPNLTVNGGASALTFGVNSYFKNVDFTGSTCTVSNTINVCGNLTLATGGTYTGAAFTFLVSTTFSTNTKTLGGFGVNGTGITVTLGDALTVGVTGTTTLTSGTLDLAGFTLSTGIFSSTNSNTRVIAFGTGNIALTSFFPSTINLSMAIVTGFTWTGTGGFTRNMIATATMLFGTTSGGSTTNAPNLTVNAGASSLILGGFFKNVNFTGSSTTVTATYNACGNLTLATGTYTGVAPTFLTSGTLTTNNKTISALTVNGLGTTTTLADALTTTGALTLTDGTLQLKSGTTTTVGSFVTTGTTLKYLQSTTPGVQATISDISGTNTATYLSIQDSNATGGAVWDAVDPTNVDAGNNTGWRLLVLVPVTGVSATGVIGDVTIYLLLVVSATGVQVIGVIGDVVVTGTAFVYPIGVVAYGLIGPVNVWGLVIDGQVPNWTIIADGLPSAWSAVSNPQTPSWQPVVN